ncbi:hypothetical protein [Rhizobium sp. AN80A]|uniref:hypothetical protein n=1 Tax=Rhizobium sp. AN80A TaxID=3040673 RepID=UPI0024B3BB09|nr:hypothetical protein [Rhizobium sp. AN80A]
MPLQPQNSQSQRPDGSIGEQPGTGTVLMALGQAGIDALSRAVVAGLGITVQPRKIGEAA